MILKGGSRTRTLSSVTDRKDALIVDNFLYEILTQPTSQHERKPTRLSPTTRNILLDEQI